MKYKTRYRIYAILLVIAICVLVVGAGLLVWQIWHVKFSPHLVGCVFLFLLFGSIWAAFSAKGEKKDNLSKEESEQTKEE